MLEAYQKMDKKQSTIAELWTTLQKILVCPRRPWERLFRTFANVCRRLCTNAEDTSKFKHLVWHILVPLWWLQFSIWTVGNLLARLLLGHPVLRIFAVYLVTIAYSIFHLTALTTSRMPTWLQRASINSLEDCISLLVPDHTDNVSVGLTVSMSRDVWPSTGTLDQALWTWRTLLDSLWRRSTSTAIYFI